MVEVVLYIVIKGVMLIFEFKKSCGLVVFFNMNLFIGVVRLIVLFFLILLCKIVEILFLCFVVILCLMLKVKWFLLFDMIE